MVAEKFYGIRMICGSTPRGEDRAPLPGRAGGYPAADRVRHGAAGGHPAGAGCPAGRDSDKGAGGVREEM